MMNESRMLLKSQSPPCAILSPFSNWATVLPRVASSATSKTFMVCAEVFEGINKRARPSRLQNEESDILQVMVLGFCVVY